MRPFTMTVPCTSYGGAGDFVKHRVAVTEKGRIVLLDHNEDHDKIMAALANTPYRNLCNDARLLLLAGTPPGKRYEPEKLVEALHRDINNKREERKARKYVAFPKPVNGKPVALPQLKYRLSADGVEYLQGRAGLNVDLMEVPRVIRSKIIASRRLAKAMLEYPNTKSVEVVDEALKYGDFQQIPKVWQSWSTLIRINLNQWISTVLIPLGVTTRIGHVVIAADRHQLAHDGTRRGKAGLVYKGLVITEAGVRKALLYIGASGSIGEELL